MTEDWFEHTMVPAAIAAAVFLLVLWPTRHGGTRLLKNWGIAEPAEPQVTEAVRYLRQRRILYVVLFVVVPPALGLVWPGTDDSSPASLLVPMLVAMLVAELVATLRPVSGIRVASLDRRTWRDLVPRWAVAVFGTLVALAVVLSVLGLAAQPWADRFAAAVPGVDSEAVRETGWYTLAGVAMCVAVVGVLVHLAVRRPASDDGAVDVALRMRSARVAVAIGFGWLAAMANGAAQRLGFLDSLGQGPSPAPAPPGWLGGLADVSEIVALPVLVMSIVCWMWLAMPTRRSLANVR